MRKLMLLPILLLLGACCYHWRADKGDAAEPVESDGPHEFLVMIDANLSNEELQRAVAVLQPRLENMAEVKGRVVKIILPAGTSRAEAERLLRLVKGVWSVEQNQMLAPLDSSTPIVR